MEEEVEDEGIGEAAHGEDKVVLPTLRLVSVASYAEPLTDVLERLGGDLANGEIGEPRSRSGNTDSFGTNTVLHDLDWAI